MVDQQDEADDPEQQRRRQPLPVPARVSDMGLAVADQRQQDQDQGRAEEVAELGLGDAVRAVGEVEDGRVLAQVKIAPSTPMKRPAAQSWATMLAT